MSGLSQNERKSIAEKLMEMGNLFGAGFIIGQFVPVNQTMSSTLMFAGIGFWVAFWMLSISILRGGWAFMMGLHPAIITAAGILIAAFCLTLWINKPQKKGQK